ENNLMYEISILVVTKAASLKELKQKISMNEKIARSLKMEIKLINNKMFDEYKLSIMGNNISDDDTIFLPSSSLINGYGFTSAIYNDGNNLLLGSSTNDEIVIFNQFYKKDKTRTNHNAFIIGASGRGKTTLTQKVILNQIANGNKVLVIDPQAEYLDIANKLGGKVINFSSNDENKINPLQIINYIDEEKTSNDALIIKHLEFLRNYFAMLLTDASEIKLNIIIECIKDLYREYGIFDCKGNVADIPSENWPVFSDLMKVLSTYNKKFKNEKEKQKLLINILFELEESLKVDLTSNGAIEKIYNHTSTMNLENNFIVFNTKEINNTSSMNNKYSKIAMYTILNYINGMISKNYVNENQKVLLIIDEAHLYIDSENMTNLDFMFKTTKTIRKFNGGVIFTTQNPSDFTSTNNVSSKAQAILQNCDYSFIFGLKSKDIEAVNEMYKYNGGLNQSESTFLSLAGVGECLFNLNNHTRITMNIFYNKTEKALLFKKGNYEN
ncbi:VirB4 family type IV secretion system protein, partial [Mycoplasma buteonis]|uniref:VirB4 family type IV secretion system protein n=1 Tax=Mycoplasma buteonis TaxID=171280 RepID=UPI00056BEAEA